MNFIKFNLIVVTTIVTFIISDSVYGNAPDEDAIRKTCKDALLAESFNGALTHDAFEVNIPNLSDTFVKDVVDNTTITQNYKAFVYLIFTKITTTDTKLDELYCDRIDPLIRLGFTGYFSDDKVLLNTGAGKSREDAKAYLDYLNDANTFRYAQTLNGILDAERANALKEAKGDNNDEDATDENKKEAAKKEKIHNSKLDMLYEYIKSNKWINIPIDNAVCKKQLNDLGYTGQVSVFKTQYASRKETASGPEEKYHKFMNYLLEVFEKEQYSDKNTVDVFCDIVDTLESNHFTGNAQTDSDIKSGDEKLNELIYSYTHFLKKYQYDLKRQDYYFIYEFGVFKTLVLDIKNLNPNACLKLH